MTTTKTNLMTTDEILKQLKGYYREQMQHEQRLITIAKEIEQLINMLKNIYK